MRNVWDVIDSIIDVVPDEELDLIRELRAIHSSSIFAAPELQGDMWARLQTVLIKRVGLNFDPAGCWRSDVEAIFSNR